MPKAAKWIILTIAVIVLLAPLSEMFDHEDLLSQDGSDFVFYIIALICLLAFAVKHRKVIRSKFASFETRALSPAGQYCLERGQNCGMSQEFRTVSSHVDLRI
jgi:hypothetical protein